MNTSVKILIVIAKLIATGLSLLAGPLMFMIVAAALFIGPEVFHDK